MAVTTVCAHCSSRVAYIVCFQLSAFYVSLEIFFQSTFSKFSVVRNIDVVVTTLCTTGLLRCGKSCRLRWSNYLRPDIKRGHFSEEEEQLIFHLHAALGNRWAAIASRLPQRTDNEIKNHWNTHLKKRLLQNMGIDSAAAAAQHTKAKGSCYSALQELLLAAGSCGIKENSVLTHMSQWDRVRAEAEARLAHTAVLSSTYKLAAKTNHTDVSSSLWPTWQPPVVKSDENSSSATTSSNSEVLSVSPKFSAAMDLDIEVQWQQALVQESSPTTNCSHASPSNTSQAGCQSGSTMTSELFMAMSPDSTLYPLDHLLLDASSMSEISDEIFGQPDSNAQCSAATDAGLGTVQAFSSLEADSSAILSKWEDASTVLAGTTSCNGNSSHGFGGSESPPLTSLMLPPELFVPSSSEIDRCWDMALDLVRNSESPVTITK